MVSVSDIHSGQSSKQLISGEEWLNSLQDKFPDAELAVVRRACEVAEKAHEGQLRRSGEPYFQHSLSVATILAGVRMDHETLAAALLHDVVEDTDLTLDDIRRDFGDSIANLVDGVTRMVVIQGFNSPDDAVKKEKKERAQAESLRKMLLAMVEDVRVVLIKLADRTHNMRTLGSLPEHKQKRIARETLDIYAPLANRLGMWQIKWELEDLSFRYIEPELYKRMARMVDERRVDREQYIKDFLARLQREISATGVNAVITGRPKHIYSIYRKMERKGIDYQQVYDTRGIRVLVDSVPDCYTVLGIVHSLWRYIPGEFDDYIATPKENGYQSIHTAIFGPQGKVVEVQVRTHQMHEDNELGVAAHWRYKEGAAYDAGFESKIVWLRQLLEWKDEVADADEFVDQFKSDAFDSRIYIFTPKGNVVDLPAGSTPLDFAYHIHTEIGHRCRGAKVNGHIVPLTYQLNTGEQVEVLTVKHGEPSLDWLNADLAYVRTSRARGKIQHWFNVQNFDTHVAAGRTLLEKELQRLGVTNVAHDAVAQKLGFGQVDDFYAAIGRNETKMSQVVRAIQVDIPVAPPSEEDLIQSRRPASKEGSSGVMVLGVGDLLTQFGNCCKPLPGDDIVGYITKGRGVTIHRKDCANVLRYASEAPERLVEVDWGKASERAYPVDVQITAFDRQGLLRDVSAILANEKINVIAVNTLSDKREHTATMTLTLEIDELDRLSKLLIKINSLPNVLNVQRKRR